MKNRILRRAASLVMVAAFALLSVTAQAGRAPKVSKPAMSCAGATQTSTHLQVCGGATGAEAGFSIQWMKAADYAANGNAWYPSEDTRLCKASFSGRANGSRYDLRSGECVPLSIGDLLFDNGASTNCMSALLAGTDYVFRSFAHATCRLSHSDFTPDLSCSTLAAGPGGGGCTRPQIYWQLFNPLACPDPALCTDWPVTSLTLGTVSYTVEELVAILKTPGPGNGLVALAHQLIAAKLSIAAGADGSAVAATIAAADALIGGLVVPPVGDGSLDSGVTAAYAATLASFNEGAIGPGACVPPDPGEDS